MDPSPPSSLVTGVPPALDRLCAELLQRAPDARPRGAEIRRLLGLRPAPEEAPRTTRRGARLATDVEAALAAADGGAPGALASGEDVEALAATLVAAGRRVLGGRSPHGLWALARLFPALKTVPGLAQGPSEPPPAPEVRRLAAQALATTLQGMDRDAAPILLIPDAARIDADDVWLLRQVMRRDRADLPSPLLLLGHACTGDLARLRSSESALPAVALEPLQSGRGVGPGPVDGACGDAWARLAFHRVADDSGDPTALAHAGRPAEAAAAWVQLAAQLPTEGALRALSAAARLSLTAGDPEACRRATRQLLSLVGVGLPTTSTGSRAAARLARLQLAARGLALGSASASADATAASRVDACFAALSCLDRVDRRRARVLQARACRLALDTGDPTRAGRALVIEARRLAALGPAHIAKAVELAGRAGALAERLDEPLLTALTAHATGQIELAAGCLRTATVPLARAARLLRNRCVDAGPERRDADTGLMLALTWLGRWPELGRRTAALQDAARDDGDVEASRRLTLAGAYLLPLLRDDVEGARAQLDAARPWLGVDHSAAAIASVDVALYGDRDPDLQPLRELVEARAAQKQAPHPLAVLVDFAVGRAAVAVAALGDEPHRTIRRALRVADACAGRLARADTPLASALAPALAACVSAAAGDHEQAARLLRRATEAQDREALTALAAVTRRRLGELVGGLEGEELVTAADRTLRELGASEPAAVAGMYAPGRWIG